MDMNIILLSLSSHDQTIYRASAVKHFLCRHKKGHIDRYQQSILCECQSVTAARPVATPAAGAGRTDSSTQREL